ncbi:MAG: Periplasmic nitrate reductase, electron transfer subunit [Gammaproteobacteria bacterium]|nr:Periplasmic nitrate reductase, electron transfer subunit [Gammaproteobacteria bacterium]
MTGKTMYLPAILLAGSTALAAENIATLRPDVDLNDQGAPPVMLQIVNDDVKRKRDYPMQPPTIPHKIENYQVDLRTNKCLSCHSRKRTEESQAPMVSVTHYMDRDGNFLAAVSPRRYFCQQCHVAQVDVRPLVNNQFKDVDEILKNNKTVEQ